MRTFHIVPLLFLLLISTGCVMGPVRYKTAGFRKSATIELCRNHTYSAWPILIPAGAITDTGITAADTIAVPGYTLVSIAIFNSDLKDMEMPEILLGIIVLPIWDFFLLPCGLVSLPFMGERDYEDIFGAESSWIPKNQPSTFGPNYKLPDPNTTEKAKTP